MIVFRQIIKCVALGNLNIFSRSIWLQVLTETIVKKHASITFRFQAGDIDGNRPTPLILSSLITRYLAL
jgi:hypothetical protein